MERHKWKVFAYSLLLWISAVTATIKSSVPRGYAFSYATPDGSARYEKSNGVGGMQGGYQYRTPDGGVVAVRYTDEHGYRATGDNYERHYDLPGSFRRLYSYTYGSTPQEQYLVSHPKKSYAFSYSTADGQTRFESRSPEGVVKGGYRYTAPDGTKVAVRYIADKDGFRTVNDNQIYHPSARVLNLPAFDSLHRTFKPVTTQASTVTAPQASTLTVPQTAAQSRAYYTYPSLASPTPTPPRYPTLGVEVPPSPGTVVWPPARALQSPAIATVTSGFSYPYATLPSAYTPFRYVEPTAGYSGHSKTARYVDSFHGGQYSTFPFNIPRYYPYVPINPIESHSYQVNF